ncbi:MAG: ATP-dependent DNA helicase [Thermoplasmata archaeon]
MCILAFTNTLLLGFYASLSRTPLGNLFKSKVHEHLKKMALSDNPLFPYRPRKNQEDIMDDIRSSVKNKIPLVFQASTGSGKTICTLAPTLEYAKKNGKRILYLTRTNSQQKQVILELRRTGGSFGTGLQGRNNTCILALNDEDLSQGSAEELSKYCGDRKKEVRQQVSEGKEKFSCPYYAGLLTSPFDELRRWAEDSMPTNGELMEKCTELCVCPYEASKLLVNSAVLVTAPYVYFFVPFIRRRLLEWMGVEIDDLIVVVDEAHNLPDYARELASGDMSQISIERTVSEGVERKDPKVGPDIPVTQLGRTLSRIIDEMVREYVTDEDGLVPPDELKTELMHSLKVNTNDIKDIVFDLKLQGELVQQEKRDDKKLPRSHMNSMANFLQFWINMERSHYIKLVKGGSNPAIEGYCLDPSHVTECLNHCHTSIHMSGTLEPLNEYRDSLGLPFDTVTRIYPPPFPPENKAVYYLEEITTKYQYIARDGTMVEKIRGVLKGVLNGIRRNTVVFFPSYKLMSEVCISFCQNNTFVEEQDMSQPELMALVDRFKRNGGTLFSVIGGRISEGMDFPGKELEVAIIVGIPYPKPTARQKGLQHYYDIKFGKGWEYTVKAPAVRKILQSSGRVVRSEKDLGVVLIMDDRAVHFKEYLPGLKPTEDPGQDIREFFHRKVEQTL